MIFEIKRRVFLTNLNDNEIGFLEYYYVFTCDCS